MIVLFIPLFCFAGESMSQNDYIEEYNQKIAFYGFANQATIVSPLNDTHTFYLPEEKRIILRSYDTESFSFAVCIDEKTQKAVAVQVLFDDEFLYAANAEDKKLILSICKAMMDAFCEVSTDKQESITKKLFTSNGDLNDDVRFFDTDFVFESGYEGNSPVRSATSFSITTVSQDDFNSNFYWTPYNSLEYFIQAGDIAMVEQDYDAAVMFYEQTRGVWDELEQAYRAKADNLLAQGDIEGSNEVLAYSGLDETVPYSDIVNGTWEAVFWYDFATNQNHSGVVDFGKSIPREYLQTAKSRGCNVILNITDNTIDTLNSSGQKSSKEYSWIQNNMMAVYYEDGYEEDFLVIDENTIHLGGSDGILVFARSDRDWNIESETFSSSEKQGDKKKMPLILLTDGKIQVELLNSGWQPNEDTNRYHPKLKLKVTNVASQSINKLEISAAFNNDEKKESWDEIFELLIYPNSAPLKSGYSKSVNIQSTWGVPFFLDHLVPNLTADIYVNNEYLGTFTIEKKLY